MRCDHAVLCAYHDGELPEPERADVAAHVKSCPACREELARLREVSAMFAAARDERAPPELAHRVSEPAAAGRRGWQPRAAAILAGALLYVGAAWSLGLVRGASGTPANDPADPLRAALPLLVERAPAQVAVLESSPEMRLLSEVLTHKESR